VSQSKIEGELKTLVIYWSATGNTEKVANTIEKALTDEGIKPVVKKLADASEEELYDYNLVFLGTPSYQFLPPEPVQNFLKQKMKVHGERGDIKLRAPKIPGKNAVIFCTYSGPHTGIREAIPVGEYIGQFFEHIGFEVAAKWYTVGEFHNREELSTKGVLGDIRGRPNEQDLAEVASNITTLIKSLQSKS
jgi:flavodoxin